MVQENVLNVLRFLVGHGGESFFFSFVVRCKASASRLAEH
jgi:hypothetical protein